MRASYPGMSRPYLGGNRLTAFGEARTLPLMVSKISLSLDTELLASARSIAGRRGLSALVNDALRIKLQHARLQGLLDDLDTEFGTTSEAELEKVRKIWPKKKKARRAA
jgi:hypothetical protein